MTMRDRAAEASGTRVEEIAAELVGLLGQQRQIRPYSSRYHLFDLAEAYAVAERVRESRAGRGENAVGRKIGFTNRAVWSGHGISGPIWNYMFDSTVRELSATDGTCSLRGFSEPRIEPEIVLHLERAPDPAMDATALLGCVDWIAPAFELVYSVFPNWDFTAADAAAAFGVHGALMLGDRVEIAADRGSWEAALSSFEVLLSRSDGTARRGHARNVLGGPIQAVQFLLRELARYPACRPLNAGEIVTTGTLTEAMPVLPGEAWTVAFSGIDCPGLSLTFR